MPFVAYSLSEQHPQLLQWWGGNKNNTAFEIVSPESAHPQALSFCSDLKQVEMALKKKASILIVATKLKSDLENIPVEAHGVTGILLTPSVPLALAHLLSEVDRKKQRFDFGSSLIHPSALLHPTADVASDVIVGPFTYIGANTKIARGVRIGSHCTIENDVSIAENCILHSQVFIGARSLIGARCEIHPQSVLGSDGFGFTPDAQGHILKIPQIGRVVLEHDVELGSQCAIDRATLGETRIGHHSKLDNFCHVAHNCKIGANARIAAGFISAGSVEIGNDFMCGGKVVIASHLKITDRVHLGALSAVTKSIEKAGAYGGYPLQPIKDYLRTTSSLPALPRLRKTLSRVMKHLQLSEAEDESNP